MSQSSIERLREYLGQLPPKAQALLMREFERAIERDTRLGGPGPWVTDAEAGAALFATLGAAGVVREVAVADASPEHRDFLDDEVAQAVLLLLD